MKNVIRKLKSNSGVSMLFALGIMLICSMVASTTLFAAATGANRNVNRDTQQQRGYLVVSSAAQLAAEELDGKVYVGKDYREVHECGDPDTVYDGFVSSATLTGVLGDLLEDACNKASWSPGQPLVGTGFSETVKITTDDPRLDEVECVCSIYFDSTNNCYVLELIFSQANVLDNSDYTVTLSVKGAWNVEETSEEIECTATKEQWVTNGDGSLTKEEVDVTYLDTKYTKTFTITWGEPTLIKGSLEGAGGGG